MNNQNQQLNNQWDSGGSFNSVDYLNQQNSALGSNQSYTAQSGYATQPGYMENLGNSISNWWDGGAQIGGTNMMDSTTQTANGPVSNSGWFGNGVAALQGIGNYFQAEEQMAMQKEAMNNQLAFGNRNVENQATQYNEKLGNQSHIRGTRQGISGNALTEYTNSQLDKHGLDGSAVA